MLDNDMFPKIQLTCGIHESDTKRGANDAWKREHETGCHRSNKDQIRWLKKSCDGAKRFT
jgi:hypothetical protein